MTHPNFSGRKNGRAGSIHNGPNQHAAANRAAAALIPSTPRGPQLPLGNGAVPNGWGKWLYNRTIGRCVGRKYNNTDCNNTGGRRTRRTKSRRAKTRRARRS